MDQELKKKRSVFWPVYITLTVLAILASLFFLKTTRDSLEEKERLLYESSREACLDRYVSSFSVETVADQMRSQINKDFQSPDEFESLIAPLFSEELKYAPEEEDNAYYIYNDSQILGEIKISENGSAYEVTEEDFDFSYLFIEKSITVPSEYTVSINGKTVGEKYISERDIEYPYLHGLYRDVQGLPLMVTYKAPGIFGDIGFEVKDGNGKITEIRSGSDGSEYLVNAGEEDKTVADDIAPLFFKSLAEFSSGLGTSVYNYVLPGSEIAERLGHRESDYYKTSAAEISDLVCNGVYRINDELIIADYSYNTLGTTWFGINNVPHNCKLALRSYNGMYLVEYAKGYAE